MSERIYKMIISIISMPIILAVLCMVAEYPTWQEAVNSKEFKGVKR